MVKSWKQSSPGRPMADMYAMNKEALYLTFAASWGVEKASKFPENLPTRVYRTTQMSEEWRMPASLFSRDDAIVWCLWRYVPTTPASLIRSVRPRLHLYILHHEHWSAKKSLCRRTRAPTPPCASSHNPWTYRRCYRRIRRHNFFPLFRFCRHPVGTFLLISCSVFIATSVSSWISEHRFHYASRMCLASYTSILRKRRWSLERRCRVANISSNTNTGTTVITQVQQKNPSQLLYISLSFGFSLAVNAWVFFRISGGLFNPAVGDQLPTDLARAGNFQHSEPRLMNPGNGGHGPHRRHLNRSRRPSLHYSDRRGNRCRVYRTSSFPR